MLFEDVLNVFIIASFVCAGLSFYFLFGLAVQIRKIKLVGSVRKFIGFSIFSTIAISTSLIFFGAHGYQALTTETLIAKVIIIPRSKQQYTAIVEFEQGDQVKFELAGDEVMFEAKVLKWKPWANFIGLDTAYQMDRIRGRFKNIEDERNKTATIYSLHKTANSDISEWRQKYQQLAYLLDVEHGSASYASVEEIRYFELMITVNGLLLRPVEQS